MKRNEKINKEVNDARVKLLDTLYVFVMGRIDYEPCHTLEYLFMSWSEYIGLCLFDDFSVGCTIEDFGDMSKFHVGFNVVQKAYAEAIESNMHYKDAYKLAKERVTAYADVVGKSPILMIENS